MPTAIQMLDLFLIFSGLAFWVSVVMVWRFLRERNAALASRFVDRSAVDIGVALAARASLDTNGAVIDSPSAMSFERKRREADALRDEDLPLWENPDTMWTKACLCANTDRTCPTCKP